MTSRQLFTGKVFVGMSLDGFIARTDGTLHWLVSRGEAAGDSGYEEFMTGIDTVVLGRVTYETVVAFGSGRWPYDGKHVAVLSGRLNPDADPRVTVYPDLDRLIAGLADRGSKSVYVDGARIVQSFLRAGLIQEVTITTVPVLIGDGIPLFGSLDADISLALRWVRDLGAGVVQSSYIVAP